MGWNDNLTGGAMTAAVGPRKPGTIVEMVRSWREKNPHATVADVLAKTYSQCPERARAEMKGM